MQTEKEIVDDHILKHGIRLDDLEKHLARTNNIQEGILKEVEDLWKRKIEREEYDDFMNRYEMKCLDVDDFLNKHDNNIKSLENFVEKYVPC